MLFAERDQYVLLGCIFLGLLLGVVFGASCALRERFAAPVATGPSSWTCRFAAELKRGMYGFFYFHSINNGAFIRSSRLVYSGWAR